MVTLLQFPRSFIIIAHYHDTTTVENLPIHVIPSPFVKFFPLRQEEKVHGDLLASHLCGRGSIPIMAVSGKAGSCLPLVGSLQYRTLANYMYWFPLPFQLPVVIWPVQCWKRRKTPNKQIHGGLVG